jgi:hypothetical protein
MVTTGVISALGIRDDLLVVWRGMEDPPPSEQAGYLSEV